MPPITDPSFNPSGHPGVAEVKAKANELAALIVHHAPSCRRRSVALTKLETATMWAVKAVTDPD